MDIETDRPETKVDEITSKFFKEHRTSDPREQKLVDYILRQNDSLNFVEQTTAQIGFPRWDKAVAFEKPKKDGEHLVEQGADSVYYIPFVRDSQQYVNATMIINTGTTDTTFSYLCDWQYTQVANEPTVVVSEAEKIAVFFMFLDKEVFNHQRFSIIDTTLFLKGQNVAYNIRFDTVDHTIANLNSYETVCLYVGVTTYHACPSFAPHSTSSSNILPRCPVVTWQPICWQQLILDLGDGGGLGGGGSTGGGTPPPCGGPNGFAVEGNGNTSNYNEPCGPGWEPEPIDDEPTEFNPFIADTVILDPTVINSFPCVDQILDSIEKFVVIVNNVEHILNINGLAQLSLYAVFGVETKIHTTFKIGWGLTKDSADAYTTTQQPIPSNGVDFYADIYLNPWVLKNSTRAYVASTLIHETYHAFINYKYFELQNDIIDSNQFKNLFPLYWPQRMGPYFLPGNELAQHQAMAGNLISVMAAPLKFVNFNPTIPSSMRDSIYRSLSWGGLNKTTVWRNKADTFDIKSINLFMRDTSIHAPFTYQGGNGTVYDIDARLLHFSLGCL